MPIPAIDWEGAARFGSRHVPAGPTTTPQERHETVAMLRALSSEAHAHAVQLSCLPDPGVALIAQPLSRAEWVRRNTQSAQVLLADVEEGPARGLWRSVEAKAQGVQLGLGFAAFSGKILGQFDPFSPEPALYAVAPNFLVYERDLALDPRDFRLWVLIHEQTHRLQAEAAPWLRGYMRTLVADAVRDFSVANARVDLDRVTAFMSVVEGYAETMMNKVDSAVIPTIATIKEGFARKREQNLANAMMRKVLKYDVKLAQYRDGAAFCDAVIWRHGIQSLNNVWRSPEYMPSLIELHDPERWAARVL
ncbi:MAG: zinc-dependent metalloprotease [Propionibacteriaceae bacterium]